MKRTSRCAIRHGFRASLAKWAIFLNVATALFLGGGIVLLFSHLSHIPPSPTPTDRNVGIAVKPIPPRSAAAIEPDAATVSAAVSAVCGADEATAGRYEARSDALRSIARERNLQANDVAALVAWLASTGDPLRAERLAALKNDAMNLLRSQDPPPSGFADTLIAMFEGGAHPPAVLDYCVQHLGATLRGNADDAMRSRIRAVLLEAAKRKGHPYAGTALYALAGDASATPAQEAELRRMTSALCAPGVDPAARIAAIQLAGERGYAEALPILREALSAPKRDTVTDIACLGSIGLLGSSEDIPLLRRFAALGPRFAPAAETAIKRIEARGGGDGEQR